MSDYNNRIKEWITNLVIEELNEDDSWWTSMSADQQADYIKRHPQSQKAQDAKKDKEDDGGKDDTKPTSDEVDDIKDVDGIVNFIDKHEDNLNDDEQRYLRDLATQYFLVRHLLEGLKGILNKS